MILLIGYGNPYRRDDGVGPALARMLGETEGQADLRVITPQQLTPELALELAKPEVAAVLFIDAAVASDNHLPPGACIEPRPLEPSPLYSCLGHHFPPEVLLAYASLLYGARPQAWLITVPGYDFGFGEGFSAGTAALLSAARENALGLLGRLAG